MFKTFARFSAVVLLFCFLGFQIDWLFLDFFEDGGVQEVMYKPIRIPA